MDDEHSRDPSSKRPPQGSESERRDFFKEASILGVGAFLGTSPMSAAQPPPAGAPMIQPPIEIVDFKKIENDLPDGKNTYITWRSNGSNQVTCLNKCYTRRVDHDPLYTVFVNCTVSWYAAGQPTSERTPWVSIHSNVISGTKGKVDGNRRKDKISTTTIYGSGEIVRTGEQEVSVWLTPPPELEGVSFEDALNFFMKKERTQ